MENNSKKEFQEELFNNISATIKPKKDYQASFSKTISFEHIIFSAVVFLLSVIFAFSLGVERGKRFNLMIQPLRDNVKLTTSLTEPTKIKVSTPKNQEKIYPAEIKESSKEKNEGKDRFKKAKYTIQVASYKQKKSAQREVENLSKKGFSAKFVNKNDYIIVCVGNFLDKEGAQSSLNALKKKYDDCFLRRL